MNFQTLTNRKKIDQLEKQIDAQKDIIDAALEIISKLQLEKYSIERQYKKLLSIYNKLRKKYILDK